MTEHGLEKVRRIMLRTRTRRLVLAILAMLLVAALWFGWYAYRVYQGINHITGVTIPRVTTEPEIVIPPINGNQRINILVLGSDNDKKKEESKPLTQSMIVVTIDPKHDKVGMLSIPRDFWVPIRGFPDAKIDVASKDGGFGLARATVERIFHIPIHFYAWVGLQGFQRVIDTFGGINLDISHPIVDDYYPNDITSADPYGYTRIFMSPGWRHVSGRQALDYVRSRHGDLVGDFGRSARQQQVLESLRQKLTGMNIFFNLPSLVDELQNSVQTDLSATQIYQLYELSHHITNADLTKVVLQAPTYCTEQVVDGQDALVPKWSAIRPVVRSLFAPTNSVDGAKIVPVAPATAGTRTGPKSTVSATTTPVPGATTPPEGSWSGPLPANLLYIDSGQVAEMSRSGSVHPFTGGGNSMPSISPNGRYVAFVHYSTAYASDIVIHDLKTGSESVVTRDESRNVHNNVWAAWPQWSPDGRQLLFSTDRAKLSAAPSEIRPVDLTVWSTSWPRGTPQQVTPLRPYTGGDTDPQWRPHSHQILYVSWNNNSSTLEPYSQLVLYTPATHRSAHLDPASQRVLQPALDASGKDIVFVQSPAAGKPAAIEVAPIVGTAGGTHLGPTTVLATGDVAQPAFTPDGRWVSFLRSDGDGFALYLTRRSGGPLLKVGPTGTNLDATTRPVWVR